MEGGSKVVGCVRAIRCLLTAEKAVEVEARGAFTLGSLSRHSTAQHSTALHCTGRGEGERPARDNNCAGGQAGRGTV